QVDEVARDVADLALELARRHVEEGSELPSLPERELHVRRDRPDRLDGRRDGERLAVAIEDRAARGRDLEHARVAGLALVLQEIGPQRLQVDRAADEEREA